MNKIISHNTIFPTRLKQGDYWSMQIIDDYMSLKPKPHKDVLLILGDGANLLKDIEAWYKLAEGVVPYDTFCVNYSVLICPHEYQHFGAGDAHMADMQALAKQVPDTVLKHAWNPGSRGFHVRWVRNGRGGWNGTSANLAFKIGLALDYTRMVLAGCPMDKSGNWYRPLISDNDVKKNKDHEAHIWKWQEIACRPVGRFVRSMSGNTAEMLGTPTREWLRHEVETESGPAPVSENIPEKENGNGRGYC